MKFEHGVSDFMIGGVKISADKICLNYDRKGNILIRMDILKDWDIHIGISKETGKAAQWYCLLRKGICPEVWEHDHKFRYAGNSGNLWIQRAVRASRAVGYGDYGNESVPFSDTGDWFCYHTHYNVILPIKEVFPGNSTDEGEDEGGEKYINVIEC